MPAAPIKATGVAVPACSSSTAPWANRPSATPGKATVPSRKTMTKAMAGVIHIGSTGAKPCTSHGANWAIAKYSTATTATFARRERGTDTIRARNGSAASSTVLRGADGSASARVSTVGCTGIPPVAFTSAAAFSCISSYRLRLNVAILVMTPYCPCMATVRQLPRSPPSSRIPPVTGTALRGGGKCNTLLELEI